MLIREFRLNGLRHIGDMCDKSFFSVFYMVMLLIVGAIYRPIIVIIFNQYI